MRGLADKGYAAGFNVVLLNQRNCGGTERLSAGLYHSGLTADADHVMREIADVDNVQQVVVAGYSLGGNLALKLAGDYGDAPPPQLRGVCAVSPVMELEACVRALERRQNFFYQWNFVRGLKGRMRRKAQWFPDRFALDRLDAIRSVREFDEVYTAPHFGFKNAYGLLSPRERDAGHRPRARAGAHHHRRGRSLRADGAFPRSHRGPEPAAPRHHHQSRRPLRLRDRRPPGHGRSRALRRLLGRARNPGLRDRPHRRHSSAISRFANSGPSPCSSCLK